MAIGTLSDMQVYQTQFFAGAFEVLERNVNAFNDASAGAIRIIPERLRGQFEQESFFKVPTGLISDRDPTSTSAKTATKLEQGELKNAKVDKSIGPVDNTLDSFKKMGRDIGEMAFVLGKQSAPEIQGAYLESAISGLIGSYSVAGVAAEVVYDGTAAGMDSSVLNSGLALFGDAASRVKLWVMHSKVYFDLIGSQITDKLLEVTAGALYQGNPATFGRPVLVTDSPSLFAPTGSSVASTDDVYWTFGLTEDSAIVKESEERTIIIEPVTGLDNLVMRYHGEFSYNLAVKGMAWATQVSPTDAQLAASANWSQAVADKRSLPGIAIKTR